MRTVKRLLTLKKAILTNFLCFKEVHCPVFYRCFKEKGVLLPLS